VAKDSGGIKVIGLRPTVKSLRNLGVPDSEIKDAGFESGQIVAEKSKQQGFVPVKSGKLRESIRASKNLKGASVSAGGKRVPYANPIHWGWFYDRKRGFAKNIKPNPFFARAIGVTREQVLETYERNMAKLISNLENGNRG
jgi:hypothetical protein